MTDTTARPWALIPNRSVRIAHGNLANADPSFRFFDSYEAAAEWMATFPAGCGWLVRQGTFKDTPIDHGMRMVRADGSVEAVDACEAHPFYPAEGCPKQH